MDKTSSESSISILAPQLSHIKIWLIGIPLLIASILPNNCSTKIPKQVIISDTYPGLLTTPFFAPQNLEQFLKRQIYGL